MRLDEIGDIVMTTPFLRELRRNMPKAWITLIVKPGAFNLVEICPYVNQVLCYDWATRARFGRVQRRARALKLAREHLWQQGFDLAVLPRWDVDFYNGTALVYLSGASLRVGYSENVNDSKRQLNAGYDLLLTNVLTDGTPKHEVQRALDIIRFLGGIVREHHLELWLDSDDEVFGDHVIADHRVHQGDVVVAFGPGAGDEKRMWPLSKYIQVGAWLRDRYHARIAVIGARGEESLGSKLKRALGETVIDLVGRTTLRQAAAVLKRCHMFVGNDSGPMHLAAAAGVPVIELSCHPRHGTAAHFNSPIRFGPWGVTNYILQPSEALPPCSGGCSATAAHCILSVGVDEVKKAAVDLLDKPAAPLSPNRAPARIEQATRRT